MKLPPKAKVDAKGALTYVNSFVCVFMSAVWFKILSRVDICMKVIQARQATLDVELANVDELIKDLLELRNNWQCIWNERNVVACNLGIELKLPPGGNAALRSNESSNRRTEGFVETYYKTNIVYAIIDSVVGGLTVRFEALKCITNRFNVLWNYLNLSSSEIDEKVKLLAKQYPDDVDEESFWAEMQHLSFVHSANFENDKLLPLDLLNRIYEFKLQELFPNVCICLRILLTIPATVASAERSFSKLKR